MHGGGGGDTGEDTGRKLMKYVARYMAVIQEGDEVSSLATVLVPTLPVKPAKEANPSFFLMPCGIRCELSRLSSHGYYAHHSRLRPNAKPNLSKLNLSWLSRLSLNSLKSRPLE